MRAFEFLTEADEQESPDSPDVENLKAALASKIKQLPTDEKTQKILQEIEELLASIGAGSRSEMVKNSLQLINDAEVNKAQKLLAKYFMSLEADPKSKQAMLDAWKSDALVDVKKLVTPGAHTIEDIIIGYSTNPAIQEMTDDLSQVSFLGQGKGEFLLSVFSKKVSKAGKGDLTIDGVGSVEVKTNDVGAGRFYDQQVRPSTDYQGAVNDFRKAFAKEIEEQKVMSSTGISITGLVKLHNALPVERKDDFKSLLKTVISNIFTATPDLAMPVVDSIVVGNENQAKQRYAIANLNNYMSQKDDVGILMINLSKNPYEFIFFTDNKSLNDGGLRLHSSTAYPVTNDPRNAYPQTKVQTTGQEQ
jgi:hypothetical protein